LIQFTKENDIQSIVLAGSPLTQFARETLNGKVDILADFASKTYDRATAIQLCSQADAGITGIDAMIADTGTIIIASVRQGDRLCSSLPPIHLVIAIDTPIYTDMQSFLKTASKELSYTFITGPSRTADIEKELVLGAHGPKRVVIWGPTQKSI